MHSNIHLWLGQKRMELHSLNYFFSLASRIPHPPGIHPTLWLLLLSLHCWLIFITLAVLCWRTPGLSAGTSTGLCLSLLLWSGLESQMSLLCQRLWPDLSMNLWYTDSSIYVPSAFGCLSLLHQQNLLHQQVHTILPRNLHHLEFSLSQLITTAIPHCPMGKNKNLWVILHSFHPPTPDF